MPSNVSHGPQDGSCRSNYLCGRIIFGIEIKIYVFTFWVAAGGSGLKWIKTLVKLLVRQAAAVQCILLTTMTTKQKWRKCCKVLDWSAAKVGAHGSRHWHLARTLGKAEMCVILFSPHISCLSLPRTVTQCKPVIARDELRTTNTNISLQTTLPSKKKSYSDSVKIDCCSFCG